MSGEKISGSERANGQRELWMHFLLKTLEEKCIETLKLRENISLRYSQREFEVSYEYLRDDHYNVGTHFILRVCLL